MKDKLFNDLETSMKQAVQISKGEIEPPKTTEIELIDVKAFRKEAGLTQEELAEMMVGGLETVRAWESGKRQPTGLTRKILKLLVENPDFFEKFKALSESDIEELVIRDIRSALNLTQGAFAEVLFSKIVTVQKWEQGKRTPTGLTRKFLKILGEQPSLIEEFSE